METGVEIQPQPFLAEMPITRDQRRLKVRIYPPPPDQPEDDQKPFVVKDLKGNEIGELSLNEQVQAEILVFGKPTAETYHRLELQKKNGRKTL